MGCEFSGERREAGFRGGVTEKALDDRLKLLEARLTARIVGAQMVTAALLFGALKWLG